MKKTNRLITEKSPYLLQHAHNPVEWYPWGPEAFALARKLDKPVFLSIGYSTCHWCHVMEKESFEDDEIAGLMNEAFVNIKVDREERPDIDSVYMSVCQMMTGGGGWPMTIIMTPDKKPFFAGTYFPKDDRYGRIGMRSLIPRISDVWKNKRADIDKSANEISEALQNSVVSSTGEIPDTSILYNAFKEFESRYDSVYGGFGSSPKFPSPHNFSFLLRYYKRSGESKSLEMTEKTLNEMRKGGIYDQIGFGFARYSTDREWLVPHFEKMLYDQALMANAFTELFLVTGKSEYRRTAEEILTYVLRDMTSPEGGFYSAEDADSEGEEGKFYIWTEEELKSVLTENELDIASKYYNIRKEGNWVDPVHGGLNGTNILHLKRSVSQLADEMNLKTDVLEENIETIRKKLFEHREKRVHPHKDDKILTDWNGLMISAFANAASAFNNNRFKRAAVKAMEFIINTLTDKNGKLLHRFRDGEAGLPAHIDDYAFVIKALLDLYEATFNVKYLEKAIELNEIQNKLFEDESGGGYFFTASDGEELIVRQKELYDGAIPSGNSVALLNLVRIGRITAEQKYEILADKLIKSFSAIVSKTPFIFSQFLCGLNFVFGPAYEIIIAGEKKNTGTDLLIRNVKKRFIPDKIFLLKDEESSEVLEKIAPYTKAYNIKEDIAELYLCKNYTCEMPVSDPEKVSEILEKIT